MANKSFLCGVMALAAVACIGVNAQAGESEAAFLAAESGDYAAAAAHWDKLAQAGNAEAQFNLALMYHSGVNGNINEAEAVKLYQKAAENGYPKAQEFLAAGYREGWFGLPRDQQKAQYWLNQLEQTN